MSELGNKYLFDLNGRVAVITGGAGLLGLEYARMLAEYGANIVLVDLNKEKCEAQAKELEKAFKRKMLGLKADITKKEEVQEVVHKIEVELGKIDVLINNAAVVTPADDRGSNFVDFHDYPLDSWEKSLKVNLTGMFLCTQEVIKSMLKKKVSGSIINISSTYGLVGPDQSIYSSITRPGTGEKYKKPVDYSTTKSAVLNFTRYLAAYYGGQGIRVNTLTPGGVWDNQSEEFVKEYRKKTPLGRMATNTDYNGAILFLASDASAYMTGSNLVVDGGWTCW